MKSIRSVAKHFLLEFPETKHFIKKFLNVFFGIPYGSFPRSNGQELKQLKKVLYSGNWNSSSSSSGVHLELEKEFAQYVGIDHAVSVNTGGMALQMIFRALGIKPGDEVIHTCDTCVASSFAVINSFATPILSDIDSNSFMLDLKSVEKFTSSRSKIILATHMWGNSENMDQIQALAKSKNLLVVEDACLALGAKWNYKNVGTLGTAAAFSFGSLKPIQAGEGGMIVTSDAMLAKELRMLRNWGETTAELGYRDNLQLAWNGRMSEFVAAVALEQLRTYDEQLNVVSENVELFIKYLSKFPGIVHMGSFNPENKSVFTQVVLKINSDFPFTKKELFEKLQNEKIFVWHANFEPINTLSFFKNETWKTWLPKADQEFTSMNYRTEFTSAMAVYEHLGIGINKRHFIDKKSVKFLISTFERILSGKI